MKVLKRKLSIFLVIFLITFLNTVPSYSITKYGEYDPNVVLIPAHNHPYWNSRAAVASLQLGHFLYNSLLLYEVHQPESLGTDIALYGDIVVTGSLAIYFMIKSMIYFSNGTYPEYKPNYRTVPYGFSLDSSFVWSQYLPSKGSAPPGETGQRVQATFFHDWFLADRPYFIHLETQYAIRSFDLITVPQREVFFSHEITPFVVGPGFQDDNFWKNFNVSLSLGPTAILSTLVAQSTNQVNSGYWQQYGGMGKFNLTLPLIWGIALTGVTDIAYYPKTTHPIAQSGFTYFNDIDQNDSLTTFHYELQLKLLTWSLRNSVYFGQKFYTGNENTKIDTTEVGFQTGLLW